jgi:hypothetical protein
METINDAQPGAQKTIHIIDYFEPEFASYLPAMNVEIKATSTDENLKEHSYTLISKDEWMNLQYFFVQRQWYLQNMVFLRFLYPKNCWMAIADSRVHATSRTEKGIAKYILERRNPGDPLVYVVHHNSDLLMTVDEMTDEDGGEKETQQ